MRAEFVRGPRDGVDARGVQREVDQSRPLRGVAASRFAPDDDLAIVRGGCEDGAEFGVRPCEAEDGGFVAFEGRGESVGVVLGVDVEDAEGAVGGAGGEAPAVVV